MSDKKSNIAEENIPTHAWRTHEVLKIELDHYLKKRREVNGIEEEPDPDNLSGLCISGGGVRSATLGLGMFQAFIKAGKLKFFDYMSTVSGGGYIGACLSSLLSAEPLRRDKAWYNTDGEPIENNNTKFDPKELGLEEEDSLFTNELYEYPPLSTGKITTKHQLIHLRQHGEYLTPHKSIKDWDVHRLLGALVGGIVTNILTFLALLSVVVLIHHTLLGWMSKGDFIPTLQNPTTYLNQQLYIDYAGDYQEFVHNKIRGINTGKPYPDTVPLLEKRQSINQAYSTEEWEKLGAGEQLNIWVSHSLSPQFELIWLGLTRHSFLAWSFFGWGIVVAILFILWARAIPMQVARNEQEEQQFTGRSPFDKIFTRGGEEDMLNLLGKPLKKWFYGFGLVGIPVIAYIVTILYSQDNASDFNYFVMLALPLCFSLGLFIGFHALIFLYYINHGSELVSGWLYRSFYTGMQGGALLLVILTLLFPVAIVLLFGGHGLAVKLSLSFVPVITAYYFTIQSLSGRVGGKGLFSDILKRLQNPLLNLSIFLFVGLTFAWISSALIKLEYCLQNDWIHIFTFCQHWSPNQLATFLLLVALGILIALGLMVNSNDVSLHYFYRDRLAEAYLRTSGKVVVDKAGTDDKDGKNLQRVNLRNHVDLRLQHLGKDNYKAPYHLIVTALNLQGSHDLSAKTLKSEHFIFSKYFVGSRSTGYAGTSKYNYGNTKLSTAMTISAAAVSSGMGPLSFAASNFYMTLFNFRTGYWIDNPKHFIYYEQLREKAEKAKELGKKPPKPEDEETSWSWLHDIKLRWSKISHKYPLWLKYSWRELTGNLSANTRKVYVSDGGHTGDNLGLIPLIQRRCSTIVIADFEEDRTFAFNSFSQAVRLAKAIYDVDIIIDLSKLMPKKDDNDVLFSPESVAEGEIVYNLLKDVTDKKTGKTKKVKYQKKGKLIYMKSAINLLKESEKATRVKTSSEPAVFEPAPVFVLNYHKKFPQFPHQTTADQYFDEVQFEAYRMLGEHIAMQAAPKVSFGRLV
ncbi:MAG: patatin-like phospholipase family protein [Lewinellaceae bacterium]|nr:patatin-like phospholipase family protein [Saprospiraceae bacterium]MCB9344193.1 patatin-like phospholipase family protein [Lewinellaceae bacterium]